MGKKQHQKDKLYLTTKEWKEEWGGHKGSKRVPFKKLPFHCCAIAFTPFEDSVCTEDGTVFDVSNIVPYVMKYKKHPVTGQPLALKDLIQLNWHKNAEGMYDCPVTGKVFTEHTHIAAVKVTGNVYAYESLDELCFKPKNWKDLITDESFTRKDVIIIQDPLNLSGRTVEQFDHVQRGLVLDEEEDNDKSNVLRNMSEDMKRAIGALQTDEAKAAFEAGGGGRRAEAQRLLAAAKAMAAGKGSKDSKDSKISKAAGGSTAPSNSGAAVAPGAGDSGSGDWRLRAPDRGGNMPAFKPGAVTWDTEDYTTAEGQANKRKAEKLAEMAAGGPSKAPGKLVAGLSAGKMSPKERYEAEGHVKYTESFSTTGAASRSFTSTYAAVHTAATRTLRRLDRNPTKKGYVRVHTNLGDLNVELHCDMAPRTCENFIALAGMGYYDGTIFHRSIRNFMIQGGDPTGTGHGGESIYGPTFKDELDSRLVHNGRGVLSMANSGPGTNGSQFFFTYKSCRHLDFKHSVFGRVVGGLEVLTAMERIDTDDDDRPMQEIMIKGCTVFTNPYQEMEDAEKAEAEEKQKKEQAEFAAAAKEGDYARGKWFSAPGAAETQEAPEAGSGGVGKYLAKHLQSGAPSKAPAPASAAGSGETCVMAPPAAKKPKTTTFGNFDAW